MIINKLFSAFCAITKFQPQTTLRLSKYLANTGVCSRRQAEKLITQGMVQVDGQKALTNIPITPESKVKIFTQHGERMPIQESTRLWVFYKPVGMICSHDDPFNRESFYDYAKAKLNVNHLISVGRLDFNSEGLIIITNNGEVARVMELPESQIEREYRVRIYGRFDEKILTKIRQGVTINNIKYGPFWVNVENRQSRNTWLLMRLTTGKNREIRRVMRKFSLRVNRIVRVKYGPYKLLGLKPGEFYETEVEPQIKRKMYLNTRKQFIKQQEVESQNLNIDNQAKEQRKLNQEARNRKNRITVRTSDQLQQLQ